MVYKDKAPELPVLRVLASFEGDHNMPDAKTKAIGRYPLAVLSEPAFKRGSVSFSGFNNAVRRQEARENAVTFLGLQRKEYPETDYPCKRATGHLIECGSVIQSTQHGEF